MSRTLTMDSASKSKQQLPTDREAENLDKRIRERAYGLFEARGRTHGHHEEDWFRAENEIREQRQIQRAA